MSFRRRAIALVVIGAYIAVVVVSGSKSTPKESAPACQASPVGAIAAIPSGGTFVGSGCYLVPTGLKLTKPITIDGGTYVDPSMTLPAKGGFQPVITVTGSNVTLENLSVVGGNPSGKYQAKMVGQAGIKLDSTTNAVIDNVTTSSTFGDGLELWIAGPHQPPNRNVSVDGLTIDHAGRNGISPSDVDGLTAAHVTITSWGLTAVDFESDIKGIGAGNVSFIDSSWGGTYLQEQFTGPISFVDCTLSNHIVLFARQPQTAPITFTGGSLTMSTKVGTVAVQAHGPTGATFSRVEFIRTTPKNILWSATGGSHLTFTGSTLPAPRGTNDPLSTVVVSP